MAFWVFVLSEKYIRLRFCRKYWGHKQLSYLMLIIIPKPLYNETKTMLHSASKPQERKIRSASLVS